MSSWLGSARASLGFAAAAFLTFSFASASSASNAEQATDYVRDLAQVALNEVATSSVSVEEKDRRFRDLLRENFEIKGIGRFVLANYWRGASADEQDRFLDVFEDVIVQKFLPVFEENASAEIDIHPGKSDAADPNLFIVPMVVKPANGGEPVKASWRVRPKAASFGVVDLMFEGISLAITFRQEYVSFLQQNNGSVAALTDELRSKVDRGAFKGKIPGSN